MTLSRRALVHIRESPLQKKVLIVLSDGGDNASTPGFRDVLAMVQRSDVVCLYRGSLR